MFSVQNQTVKNAHSVKCVSAAKTTAAGRLQEDLRQGQCATGLGGGLKSPCKYTTELSLESHVCLIPGFIGIFRVTEFSCQTVLGRDCGLNN